MRRIARLCVCLLVAVWATGAASEVLLYKGRHRPVEELLPIARSLLGDAGRAEVDARTNTLLLVGDAASLAELERVLAAQDRAPRTVLLRYREERLSQLDDLGVRVRWRVAGDGVRVGNVRAPGSGSGVVARVQGEASSRASDRAGTLRVLEGGAGRIETGQDVPIALRTRHGPSAALLSARSGFEARPRILDDGRVLLEIAPYDAQITADGVAHAGAATQVVVTPGEEIVLGGLAQQGSGTSIGTAGAEASRSADERVLLIRVDVEDPLPVVPADAGS